MLQIIKNNLESMIRIEKKEYDEENKRTIERKELNMSDFLF
tara:strand:- start:39 stop:161 length:123 start_codon:yes stop_codon:yes gene_type:complete